MTLKYGDVFSGMSCPAFALKQLGIDFTYEFACDINQTSRSFLKENHQPKQLFTNVKDIIELPHIDLLVAGFPCQPYSTATTIGNRGENHRSHDLFAEALRCINLSKPKYFILENVAGLTYRNNRPYFQSILDRLNNLTDYKYGYKLLNSKDYGAPMSRNRLWIVGAKTELWNGYPKFNERPQECSLWDIIDKTLNIPLFVSVKYNEYSERYSENGYYIDNGQCTGRFNRLHKEPHPFAYCVTASNKPALYLKTDNLLCKRNFTDTEICKLFGLTTPIKGSYSMASLLGNGMEIRILMLLIDNIINPK